MGIGKNLNFILLRNQPLHYLAEKVNVAIFFEIGII